MAYQDYLRADPDNPTALANLGLVKMNLGKFREADFVLRKALAFSPEDAFSQFILGVNAYQEGNLNESKTALDGCLKVDPHNSQAYHYLGVIAIEEGQREQALVQFNQAVQIDPTYGTAHYNLSVLYATGPEPNLELARSHYEKALANGAEQRSGYGQAAQLGRETGVFWSRRVAPPGNLAEFDPPISMGKILFLKGQIDSANEEDGSDEGTEGGDGEV